MLKSELRFEFFSPPLKLKTGLYQLTVLLHGMWLCGYEQHLSPRLVCTSFWLCVVCEYVRVHFVVACVLLLVHDRGIQMFPFSQLLPVCLSQNPDTSRTHYTPLTDTRVHVVELKHVKGNRHWPFLVLCHFTPEHSLNSSSTVLIVKQNGVRKNAHAVQVKIPNVKLKQGLSYKYLGVGTAASISKIPHKRTLLSRYNSGFNLKFNYFPKLQEFWD